MSLQFTGFSKDHEKVAFTDRAAPEGTALTHLAPGMLVNLINTYAQTCIQAETIEPMRYPAKPQRQPELDEAGYRAIMDNHRAQCNEVRNANRHLEACKGMAPERLASGLELLKGLRAYEQHGGVTVAKAKASIGVAFFEGKQQALAAQPQRPGQNVRAGTPTNRL